MSTGITLQTTAPAAVAYVIEANGTISANGADLQTVSATRTTYLTNAITNLQNQVRPPHHQLIN